MNSQLDVVDRLFIHPVKQPKQTKFIKQNKIFKMKTNRKIKLPKTLTESLNDIKNNK